jgi:para-aminobenzoate synthetase component 1
VALGRTYPCLLDSGRTPSALGRRSYAASDPFLVLDAKGRSLRLRWLREGRVEHREGNPFEALRELLRRFEAPPGPWPLAHGGAIGYLAYDLLHHLERIPHRAVDDLGVPDLFFAFYDAVAAFDLAEGRGALASGPPELRRLWAGLEEPDPEPAQGAPAGTGALACNFTPDRYRAAVERVREHIAAGDVYQVNLSQRFSVPYAGSPLAFYDRLRTASPAPFGACLFPDGFAVLSNSPERYLRIDGDRIETRPIKGTRPRGRGAEEDRRLAEELRTSVKDRAEHVMIVDLERNDLGRVCTYESVHVPEFEVVESYANVHHLVSTVAGRVHPSKGPVDCIRNSFPGGSITGAPKVRAMELIEELEPTTRGVYCGSVGYIDFSGRVDLSIAIRTALLKDGRLHFQVGGGIVHDSDPEEEYQETIVKAQAFLKVVTGEGRLWEG